MDWRTDYDRNGMNKMMMGFNILRGALAWFDSHEVEKKLGHVPQWVTMARELLEKDKDRFR